MNEKNQLSMVVPFFDYTSLYRDNREDFMALFDQICSRGAFILQKELHEFESRMADFLSIKHAIGVGDGTNGLILALLAAGIGRGDEVIVPSHTFVASVGAIHFVGAQPVLVECQSDHLVDPGSVRKAMTKKTRALMPVHLNGRTCNMAELQYIAAQNNLIIIEDAAQALGAKFQNQSAGTFGLAAAFSFYPAKNLGCFGDGGLVVTNDDGMAHKIRAMRDHGRDAQGNITMWGYNSRLDNLQAAILNFKLKSYEGVVKRRREIAAHYHEGLADLTSRDEGSYWALPPGPQVCGDYFDVFQNYEIEVGRRDELKSYLESRGVRTIIQWGGRAIHQWPSLDLQANLPITEEMTARFLMLPMNHSLTDEQVRYVVSCIREFYKA